MYRNTEKGGRILALKDAFRKDGFETRKIVTRFNRTGICAESRYASNYDTGVPKRAYYIEGNRYEMGYLLGLLAEKEISSMSNEFAKKVVFNFIGTNIEEKIKVLQDILMKIVFSLSKKEYEEQSKSVRDEIKGIFDGCKSSNPETKVSIEKLVVLNLGIDILCSRIYSGRLSFRGFEDPDPADFDVPIMCNAFSVSGSSAGNGHYLGRDFMFPTAGIFQDVAAMIIYNPINVTGEKAYPFVSVTAPGFVGSISGMNTNGVAMGVDMVPGANCNPDKIGTNSLLLVRKCIEGGGSAEEAVDIIRDTERGVSWNYIIADGAGGRACVAETGASEGIKDFTAYPDDKYSAVLPDADFIKGNMSSEFVNGMMVRWNDYIYPSSYITYNEALWNHYNKTRSDGKGQKTESKETRAKEILPDAFGKKGYISRNLSEKNCPSVFYFSPQREDSSDIVILTNHFIIPEMRYFTMNPWTARISGEKSDDIQWRYDELNFQIHEAIEKRGSVDFETARELIDFLAPYRKHPGYYSGNPRSRDGRELQIHGCTSVFDLIDKTVESHYGYYCDKWVRISLDNYMPI